MVTAVTSGWQLRYTQRQSAFACIYLHFLPATCGITRQQKTLNKGFSYLLNKYGLRAWSRLSDVRSPQHYNPESDMDREPTNSNNGI